MASFALGFFERVAFAIWMGGFTFYAAVVVPDLHENLGGMETGEISRRVAIFLYAIGSAALTLGWLRFLTHRDRRSGRRGKLRLGLLSLSGLLLIELVWMHRSMGIGLDSGRGQTGFLSSHETYLTVWTVQWLAILGWMAIDLPPTTPSEDD